MSVVRRSSDEEDGRADKNGKRRSADSSQPSQQFNIAEFVARKVGAAEAMRSAKLVEDAKKTEMLKKAEATKRLEDARIGKRAEASRVAKRVETSGKPRSLIECLKSSKLPDPERFKPLSMDTLKDHEDNIVDRNTIAEPGSLIKVLGREDLNNTHPSMIFMAPLEAASDMLPNTVKRILHRLSYAKRHIVPVGLTGLLEEYHRVYPAPLSWSQEIATSYFAETYVWGRRNPYRVWSTVLDVWDSARRLRGSVSNQMERRDTIISPLFKLTRDYMAPDKLDLPSIYLNVESIDMAGIEISPLLLYPTDNNGNPMLLVKDLDFCFAVRQAGQDEKEVDTALKALPDEESSLSQSLHPHLRDKAIFLYVAVQNESVPYDPLIPLSIWMAAGFKKFFRLGFATNMPLFGITIAEDTWDLWIAFKKGDDVVIIAPESMGSTTDPLRILQIISVLLMIMQWAIRDFRDWFGDMTAMVMSGWAY